MLQNGVVFLWFRFVDVLGVDVLVVGKGVKSVLIDGIMICG